MDRCHYGVQGHSSCFASTSAKEPRTEATVLNESVRGRKRDSRKVRQRERGRKRGSFHHQWPRLLLLSLTVPLPAITFLPVCRCFSPSCICKALHVCSFPRLFQRMPLFSSSYAVGARNLEMKGLDRKIVDPMTFGQRRDRVFEFSDFFSLRSFFAGAFLDVLYY